MDRERIEREVQRCLELTAYEGPTFSERVARRAETYEMVVSLVLRERAAVWDAARQVLERVDPRFPMPDGGYGIDWSAALEDAIEEVTALAAQERAS